MPTVLITGANRGLGLEFVRQYAADGARVTATARDERYTDGWIANAGCWIRCAAATPLRFL